MQRGARVAFCGSIYSVRFCVRRPARRLLAPDRGCTACSLPPGREPVGHAKAQKSKRHSGGSCGVRARCRKDDERITRREKSEEEVGRRGVAGRWRPAPARRCCSLLASAPGSPSLSAAPPPTPPRPPSSCKASQSAKNRRDGKKCKRSSANVQKQKRKGAASLSKVASGDFRVLRRRFRDLWISGTSCLVDEDDAGASLSRHCEELIHLLGREGGWVGGWAGERAGKAGVGSQQPQSARAVIVSAGFTAD